MIIMVTKKLITPYTVHKSFVFLETFNS